MSRRVVVTGLGVVSPNGMGVPAFLDAIRNGVSGIRHVPQYEALKFNCQVAGLPQFEWERLKNYVSEVTFHGLQGRAIAYGLMAAVDAWRDAGNEAGGAQTLSDTGCVFGSSVAEVEDILRKSSFDEGGYPFAVNRHSDLVAALGLPDFAVGYGYANLSNGELPDGLTEDDIIKVS